VSLDTVAAAYDAVQTAAPRLSADLAARGVALRPCRDSDADFLRDVYVASRWDEMAPAGWPAETTRAFLRDQYRLQDLHYRKYYADAAWCVIEIGGERAGRLYVLLQGRDLRVVDIALMPAFRNRGVGGALLEAIQGQAAAVYGASKVSVHVEQSNPATRLYQRLGFRFISTRGPYRLLEWPVEPQPKTAS
jgi:ribosomal protein S18 acetylase RimI-like enzyme